MKMNRNTAMFLFLISFHTFLLTPLTPLLAQSLDLPFEIDIDAPVIQHSVPKTAVNTATALTLQALVTDNDAVSEVILFYRLSGEEHYRSIPMQSEGQKSYSVVMPKEAVLAPGLEYYIQALDRTENIALLGLPFSPFTIAVSPLPAREKQEKVRDTRIEALKSPEAFKSADQFSPENKANFTLSTKKTSASPEEEPLQKPWYKKWWVWTLALVVVGGGVALSGGGGGGSSSSSGGNGSISVSGPIQ